MASTNCPSYPPSLADWEDFKPIIIQLYADDEKSLSEVQQTLSTKYQFQASRRTYKTKFRAWGVRKYYRANSPQPNFMEPDSKPVSVWKMEFPSHCNDGIAEPIKAHRRSISSTRAKYGDSASSQSESASKTKSGTRERMVLIKRRLSSQSSLSGFVLVDEANDIVQSIMIATKTFITAFAKPEPPGFAMSDAPTTQIRPFRRRKDYIWNHFQGSLRPLKQGNIPVAFESLQKGCSLAQEYLSHPPKRALVSLLMVMGNPGWAYHQRIWQSLLGFMASMSSKILGRRHPLAHIMHQITSWNTFRRMAGSALTVMLDLQEEELGPAHPEVLLLKQSLCVELTRLGDHELGESVIREAYEASSIHNGPYNLWTLKCLRRLGNLYFEQRRWEDAERIFEKIVALDSESNLGGCPSDESSIFTCQNLSRLTFKQGNLMKSEYWAEQELELALKIYGPDDNYYADCLERKAARTDGEPPEKWFSWLEVS